MAWLFFLLSGITGLIYEVLWTRRLTLTFGHTVLAVSTVLTAFMAGLALGSYLGGLWSDRRRLKTGASFLRYYGFLEAAIGVWALLSLPLLSLVESVYLKLATSGVEGTPLFLACFCLSVMALLPPTTAMGATLPVISQFFVRSMTDLGNKLSKLYGLNTVGAVVGAALAGYLLLPSLGLTISIVLAACLNLAIGAAAYLWSKQATDEAEAPAALQASGQRTVGGLLLPACFAATGMASMAFQVAWTRGLALSLGSSVYAFSTILVVFLSGLGVGSLAYARILRATGRSPRLEHLGWLQFGIAASAALTIPLIGYLPWIFFRIFPWISSSFANVLLADVGLCALVLILPTLLMGLSFPLVTQLYAEGRAEVGKSIGAIYSANTLGCIVGSFFSGFLLVPQFGAQHTLQAASCLVFLVSAVVFSRWSGRVPALICAALVWLIPPWDPGLLAGGVAVYAGRHQGFTDQQLRRTMFRPPAFYRDGLSSTVSVNFYGIEEMAVRVNGKVDASLAKYDRLTMNLTGLLPILYRPQAESAVVVGLGSGFTLRALGHNPAVKEIHCVELEPAMVEADRYWAPFNGHILQDPRVKMHVTDGRTFILGSPRTYDLIVCEPSNPWLAGIGNLFTLDFYRTCQKRLNQDGVMCQWINLYAMSVEDLRTVLRGFFEVFPHGDVWQSAPGDLILIGSNAPMKPDLGWLKGLREKDELLRSEMVLLDLPAADALLGHYICDRAAIVKAVEGAAFNRDDRPILEFSAPCRSTRPSRSTRTTPGSAARSRASCRSFRNSPGAFPTGGSTWATPASSTACWLVSPRAPTRCGCKPTPRNWPKKTT